MGLAAKRQVSAGGVVARRQGDGWEIALIARKGRTIWCLPKGHIEAGETPEQASLREVREETGVTAEILQRLGEVSYWFASKVEQARFFKTVHFFLMWYTGGSTDYHDAEVDEVRWFPLAQAVKRMTYPSERKLVRQAEKALETLHEIRRPA